MVLNVIYSGVVLFFIIQFYTVVNTIMVGPAETAEEVAVGVEPILFGLLYMGFDMLFVWIKNMVVKVFRDANAKAQNGDGK